MVSRRDEAPGFGGGYPHVGAISTGGNGATTGRSVRANRDGRPEGRPVDDLLLAIDPGVQRVGFCTDVLDVEMLERPEPPLSETTRSFTNPRSDGAVPRDDPPVFARGEWAEQVLDGSSSRTVDRVFESEANPPQVVLFPVAFPG